MKYKETGFRAIYHNFCLVELNDNIKKIMTDLPGAEDANGVLTYGYYDREAGLTLELLAAAKINEKDFQYAAGNPEVTLKLRIEALGDTEFYVVSDEDGKMSEKFADKMEMLKGYDPENPDIEKTREMQFLDPFRNDVYIDDILVRLIKDGLKAEECWTRIIGLGEHWFMGTLLNEPYQNFGWHEGEKIAFFVQKDDNDNLICFTDMNPSQKITAEDLEGGTMLKEAVARFNAERNEPNFLDVLEILRDSFVWIPCTAIMSEADTEMIKKMVDEAEANSKSLKGTEFTTNDQVRLVPDILQNEDNFYFPIFSSAEEMGDYGKDFSKIEKHILEAIPLARNNDKHVAGIVLNAFSDPFILDAKLFDLVEGMKSRIQES